ncbi:unannotated protein [freshwater metagenome]|uniref:Unannotated protein n=1 Tax=freshwater metagenome TaxID=449393 RepID=A0A6J6R647_9ZZZZ
MRAKRTGLRLIASWWAASFGAISSSIASNASLVSLEDLLKKTNKVRINICPLFSKATIVFSNVAAPGASRIALTSAN